jgi:hypothetical protein
MCQCAYCGDNIVAGYVLFMAMPVHQDCRALAEKEMDSAKPQAQNSEEPQICS